MVAPPIHEVIQAGLAFNPRLAMPMDDLRSKINALFDSLDTLKIAYLLVGGVALLSYIEGRNTQDVDLILDPADLDRMAWTIRARDHDFARADFGGLRVDLLLTDNALFAHVQRTRGVTGTFGDRAVLCASREALLLLKMYALPSLYRQGDFARAALYETDILMLHQGATVDDQALLAELVPYMQRDDLSEIRKILAEQRSRRRFGA